MRTWLAAAVTLALLAPVVSLAQTPTEVVVWHAYRGAEKAAFEKVAAQFNQANPAVKVTTLAVPYDAFADKITAAVPRGKGPDVFIFAQDRLGGWIEAGNTIAPLDFYLDDAVKGRFISSNLEAMTYKGQVWGLPFNFKVITMIYNKALVQKPPTTSAELVATASKLTNASAGQYGLAYTYADFYFHASLLNAFGGQVFDAQRKPTVNNSSNVKSLELLMKWVDQDKILPAEPNVALITQLFNTGKAAIVFNGPWFLGEIATGVDFGLAPLPKIDEAGGTPMKPWITVEGLYIAAASQHPDAAYSFINYLTDLPAATTMALEGRQTPSNTAVYDNQKVAADPILKAFRVQVENALPMPNFAEMAMFWSPVTTAMNSLTRKAATPAAALDLAQKEVTDRIATLRKGP
jgi:arabinogalactan oligomer/maltooligosaccharide transport system substrate-binding protein